MSTGRFIFVAVFSRLNPFLVGWNIMAVTLALAGKPLVLANVLTAVGL